MYQPILLHLEATAATDSERFVALHERFEVLGAYVCDADGVAADATNYVAFKIYGSDKATEIFQWSTLSSADGALAAGVPKEMKSEQKAELAVFEAGEVIKVTCENAASGKAVNAMLVLNCRQARAY